ncbi:MAG: hypothetical protein IJI92_05915 [Erysipelotrichaceae bacterium]|nr:hypothetical protein [Erysipelotrichaceae bacterium]
MIEANYKEKIDFSLNHKLCKEICSRKIDLGKIEKLLASGADPLGYEDENNGSCALEHLFFYNDIVRDDETFGVMEIVNLFLKYGMDPSLIQPAKTDDSVSVMWNLAFRCNKDTTELLKILIDNGLRTCALDEFIDHFFEDCAYVGGCEINRMYFDYLEWGFRMIMLSASYPRIIEESKVLSRYIDTDNEKNKNTDLLMFRNYDKYNCKIDFSTCNNMPFGIRNACVKIFDNQSYDRVWMFYIQALLK